MDGYLSLVKSLPNDLLLPIIAYSIQVLHPLDEEWTIFKDIFSLYTSRFHPILEFTFYESTVSIKIHLLDDIIIQLLPTTADLVSPKYNLDDLLGLFVAKISIETSSLVTIDHNIFLTIHCITKILGLKISPTPRVVLKMPDLERLPPSQTWLNKVTDIVYDSRYSNFGCINIEFTRLRSMVVKLHDFSDWDDWSNLLNFSPNIKLVVEFNFQNTDDQSELIKLALSSCEQIEVRMANMSILLNDESIKLYSQLKKGRNHLLLSSIPNERYNESELTESFNLLPQVENLKDLTIEYNNLADIFLEHDSVSCLTIRSHNCASLNLSGLKKLLVLNMEVPVEHSEMYINLDTLKFLPSHIRHISITVPLSYNSLKRLPLPPYLKSLACQAKDLPQFDFSITDHLNSLTLIQVTGIDETDLLWNFLPRTINRLILNIPEYTQNSYHSLVHSSTMSKSRFGTASQKLFGIKLDNRFDDDEIELQLDFDFQMNSTNNAICINTNTSDDANNDTPEKNKNNNRRSIYSSMFAKNWANIQMDTTKSDTKKFKFVIDEDVDDAIVICSNSLLKKIDCFSKNSSEKYIKCNKITGGKKSDFSILLRESTF